MVDNDLSKYREELKKCIEDLKHKDTFYKQIPNLLTLSRPLLAPLVIASFLGGSFALGIIVAICILLTDFFDGKLARKLNVQSKFGADLDAICDKIMFLELAIPVMLNNYFLITSFVLEGIISFVNVFGRLKGLDTKTVFAGKIKTWFLSAALLVGYLTRFLNLPSMILNVLGSMTIGSQVVTIEQYIREFNKMKELKILDDIKKECEDELNKTDNNAFEQSLIDELTREKEFLLSTKKTERNKVKVKIRRKDTQ